MSNWIQSPAVPDTDGYYAALLVTSKRPRLLYYSRDRGWCESYANRTPTVQWWCALPALPEGR